MIRLLGFALLFYFIYRYGNAIIRAIWEQEKNESVQDRNKKKTDQFKNTGDYTPYEEVK